MATPNYAVNYDDKRFTEVEADKKAALNEIDVTYGNMINNADKYYQDQIDAAQNYADKQTQLQEERTEFTINQINQQKEQSRKDYLKEQSGAYVDWQKQSGEYGANAEQMAAMGMQNTGYSESAQVSMYNTYQNRVATARESYNRAVLNYDNAIKDAQLQNNAALAEIAYNALRTQLELSLEGFQYKNSLIIDKSNKKMEVDNNYYNRYQDVLKQINTENALAEEVRQYNESLAEEKRQYNESLALSKAQFEYQKQQDDAKSVSLIGGGGGSSRGATVRKNAEKSSKDLSGGLSSLLKKDVASWKETNNASNSGSSKNLPIDNKSLNALGLRWADGATLNSMVDKGYLKEVEKNGKLTFQLTEKGKKNRNYLVRR